MQPRLDLLTAADIDIVFAREAARFDLSSSASSLLQAHRHTNTHNYGRRHVGNSFGRQNYSAQRATPGLARGAVRLCTRPTACLALCRHILGGKGAAREYVALPASRASLGALLHHDWASLDSPGPASALTNTWSITRRINVLSPCPYCSHGMICSAVCSLSQFGRRYSVKEGDKLYGCRARTFSSSDRVRKCRACTESEDPATHATLYHMVIVLAHDSLEQPPSRQAPSNALDLAAATLPSGHRSRLAPWRSLLADDDGDSTNYRCGRGRRPSQGSAVGHGGKARCGVLD